MIESSNKRLAKNTLVLYFRMFVTMIISLYTSRIVLNALGVEDYGLYNVIAGVVSLSGVFVAGMSSATQRFLSFELGKDDKSNTSKVFSSCVEVHLILSGILLFLTEIIGLWFLYNKLQIPEGRMDVAFWLLQFSLLSVCVNLIIIPYSAFVISSEKMNVYAFVSIFDAICKLIIALQIGQTTYDRLLLYGGLLLVVTLINFSIYFIYCKVKYTDTHFCFTWDNTTLKKIFSFSSWTMLGQGGMVLANQGTNILMNIFHTVVANAALGIANQVNAAIKGLVGNFFTAFQPQLTKTYAAENHARVVKLTIAASKISFFLIFLVSLPIILNIDFVLNLWLGAAPRYASHFCIIFIISSMIDVIGNPFWTCAYASGNIKKLQIFTFLVYTVEILSLWFAFQVVYNPSEALSVKILASLALLYIRVKEGSSILHDFNLKIAVKCIINPILFTSLTSLLVCFAIKKMLDNIVLFDLLSMAITMFITAMTTYLIGLNKIERSFLINLLKNKIGKR